MSVDASAFTVRAHHSSHLWRMEYLGIEPEAIAEKIRSGSRGNYARDVFGTSEEEASRTKDGIAGYLQSFHDLPSDASVRFTAKQQDGICDSCVVGSHCEKVRPNYDGDAEWIKGLGKTAFSLGLMDRVRVGETAYTISLGITAVTRTVGTDLYTDAETAKQLVSDRLLVVRSRQLAMDVPIRMLQLRWLEHRAGLRSWAGAIVQSS